MSEIPEAVLAAARARIAAAGAADVDAARLQAEVAQRRAAMAASGPDAHAKARRREGVHVRRGRRA